MKRKLFLLTGIIFVLLSGCGKEKNSAVKDQFESGYMELFGTHPAVTNYLVNLNFNSYIYQA